MTSESLALIGLLSLPTEIKSKIATELDYTSLKLFGATCKANAELIQATIFDSALFRRTRVGSLEKDASVMMHPFLTKISTFVLKRIEDAVIRGEEDDDKTTIVMNLAASDENTTEPPCKFLVISKVIAGKVIKITAQGEKGVTIKQLIQALVAVWNEKLLILGLQDAIRKMTRYEYHHEDNDHQFWERWEIVTVIEKDTVYLTINAYGS